MRRALSTLTHIPIRLFVSSTRAIRLKRLGSKLSKNVSLGNASWVFARKPDVTLARPDFSKPFIIQCDASNSALGTLISQIFKDEEHPIVYASHMLTATERNYSTTEKECLALIWSIKKFRPYIEGYKFKVITDHSTLKWLRNLKEPSGRLAWWALEMQQWDFDVEHRKGALHKFPDALSRMYDGVEIETAAFAEVKDPWYLRMLSEVQASPLEYQDWIVEDGMLYRYRVDPLLDPVESGEEKLKLVVPSELRKRVMKDAHRAPSSGHLGMEKTYDRIAREYYWKGMYYDINNFVRECEECQKYKVTQTGAKGLMGSRIVE